MARSKKKRLKLDWLEKLDMTQFEVLLMGLGLGIAAMHYGPRWFAGNEYWLGFGYRDASFNGPALLESAKEVDFNWAGGAPNKYLPPDTFAMKWVTCLDLSAPMKIWIAAHYDDGIRIFVDDKLLFENWETAGIFDADQTVELGAGRHPVRIEYRELGGGASLRVLLKRDGPAGAFLGRNVLRFPGWISDPNQACAFQK